jgi:hypothetical protein
MWVTDRIRVSDLGHNFGTSSEVEFCPQAAEKVSIVQEL